MMQPPIGLLGGTFDPIHYGHLRPALEVLETLRLAQVRFIPCRMPAHRPEPLFSPEKRLALVQLAIADQPQFVADDRELQRDGPSYMVDTLATLRAEWGVQTPLCLLLGQDAFFGLPTWYRWPEVFTFAHVVVMERPGASHDWPTALSTVIATRQTTDVLSLHRSVSGHILFQPVTQLDISATCIRQCLAEGRSLRYMAPDQVLEAIPLLLECMGDGFSPTRL